MNNLTPFPSSEPELSIPGKLEALRETRWSRAFKKFVMAALGSIPWAGSFIVAAAEFHDEEKGQLQVNDLFREWFEEHAEQMQKLSRTLAEIMSRLSQFDEEVEQRIQTPEYLALVRKAFRTWDQSDTDEKRELIRKLIANAAAVKLCDDDLVRLFLDWIDRYHEAHFKVIREVYKHPGATRADIWEAIHGTFPREDSAEADLFKLLIHDLTLGHVIRQRRQTTADGHFLKKGKAPRPQSRTMKSAFSDDEPYELTELGSKFVHYTMEEVVPRLGEPGAPADPKTTPSGSPP